MLYAYKSVDSRRQQVSLTPLGIKRTLERVLFHNFSLSVLVEVVLALRQLLSRIILEGPVVAHTFSPSTQKAERQMDLCKFQASLGLCRKTLFQTHPYTYTQVEYRKKASKSLLRTWGKGTARWKGEAAETHPRSWMLRACAAVRRGPSAALLGGEIIESGPNVSDVDGNEISSLYIF